MHSTSSTLTSPPLASTTLLGYVPAPTGCKVTLKLLSGAPSGPGAGARLVTAGSADSRGDFKLESFRVRAGAADAAAAGTGASDFGMELRWRVKASGISIRLLFFSTLKVTEALMASPAKIVQLELHIA